MTDAEWIALFADRIGVEIPTPDEVSALLELAGVAAHASQRTAAPIACWLAARAGRAPSEALEMARAVAPPAA